MAAEVVVKNLCPYKDGLDNLGKSGKEWGNTYTKTLNVSDSANIQQLAVGGNITASGDITGARVFNAVYNDYAEWFERGDDAKEGHIIALDESSTSEQYIKATSKSRVIVGICTQNYAHIIGGESSDDYEKHNLAKYIPVSLAGRVPVYVKGAVNIGDYIVPTRIAGVGKPCRSKGRKSVGIALESSSDEGIKLIKVLVVR